MEIDVFKHKHTTIPPVLRKILVSNISMLPIAMYTYSINLEKKHLHIENAEMR